MWDDSKCGMTLNVDHAWTYDCWLDHTQPCQEVHWRARHQSSSYNSASTAGRLHSPTYTRLSRHCHLKESAWLTSNWRGPSQTSRYATTACMGSRGAEGRDQLGHACTMNLAIASFQAKAENAGEIAQQLVEGRGAADSPNTCCLATLPTRRVMASGCCLGAMSMILSRLVLTASMHHSCARACACACG